MSSSEGAASPRGRVEGLRSWWPGVVLHRRAYTAVVATVALATAVLVGALAVGDAVRGSLLRLALDRLGGIDVVVVSEGFFPVDLADRLAAELGDGSRDDAPVVADPADRGSVGESASAQQAPIVAPAVLLAGSVVHADSERRATGVGVSGIDVRLVDLFTPGGSSAVVAASVGAGASEDLAPRLGGPSSADGAVGSSFPPVWLSPALASELGAMAGDQLVVHLPRWSEVPGASLLARRDATDVTRALRVEVAAVLPADGVSRFGLAPSQRAARNVFMRRGDVARALGRPGDANALLIGASPAVRVRSGVFGGGAPAMPAAEVLAAANDRVAAALGRVVALPDLGLRLLRRCPTGATPGVVATIGAGAGSTRSDGSTGSDIAVAGATVDPANCALDIGSRAFVLGPAVVGAAEAAVAGRLAGHATEIQPTLAYLANRLTLVDGGAPAAAGEQVAIDPAAGEPVDQDYAGQDRLQVAVGAVGRSIPYSTVLALDPERLLADAALIDGDGNPVRQLAADAMLLSAWAADDLGAKQGDTLELAYFGVGPGDQLVEQAARFVVAGIVLPVGAAADRTLLPEVRGISDARNLANWDAPFPFDAARVRPQDEEFWRAFGPTPKAFISLAAGQRLWGSRHGALTSLRLAAASSASTSGTAATSAPTALAQPAVGVEQQALDEQTLAAALLAELDLAAAGFAPRGLRAETLAGAGGSTDFAGLFVAFSMFVLVAAVVLVWLSFSLLVRTRAAELGALLALGFTRAAVLRRLLAEGAVVAGLGVVIGWPFGTAYAALMVVLLRTVWRAAVGTSELVLTVAPGSLLVGGLVIFAVALLAMWRRLRAAVRVAPRRLLAGVDDEPASGRRKLLDRLGPRGLGMVVFGMAVGAVGLAVVALTRATPSPALGFGAGLLALLAGVFGVAPLCRLPARRLSGLLDLAWAGVARFVERSRLVVVLVAAASFVLVTVAASRHEPPTAGELASGLGGYDLIGTADVPLLRDLAEPAARGVMGLDEVTLSALADAVVVPFAVVPGDDASCLNLYRPSRPRLLGVPANQLERGGFRFASSLEPVDNPWSLLSRPLTPSSAPSASEPGSATDADSVPVIPAIGDASSVQWILHQRLGGEIELADEAGRPLRLRLVALLAGSIFQGELLVSEADLRKHFPSRAGSAVFLIDLPPLAVANVNSAKPAPADAAASEAAAEVVVRGLEAGLGSFGLDVVPTAERLAAYLEVENTYLGAFAALGGLGLLLGTLGLAALVVRGVVERRRELAALTALGFAPGQVRRLVVGESAILLVYGTLLGGLAGLLAALPAVAARGSAALPFAGLAVSLLAIWLTGLLGAWLAVRLASRAVVTSALRGD